MGFSLVDIKNNQPLHFVLTIEISIKILIVLFKYTCIGIGIGEFLFFLSVLVSVNSFSFYRYRYRHRLKWAYRYLYRYRYLLNENFHIGLSLSQSVFLVKVWFWSSIVRSLWSVICLTLNPKNLCKIRMQCYLEGGLDRTNLSEFKRFRLPCALERGWPGLTHMCHMNVTSTWLHCKSCCRNFGV